MRRALLLLPVASAQRERGSVRARDEFISLLLHLPLHFYMLHKSLSPVLSCTRSSSRLLTAHSFLCIISHRLDHLSFPLLHSRPSSSSSSSITSSHVSGRKVTTHFHHHQVNSLVEHSCNGNRNCKVCSASATFNRFVFRGLSLSRRVSRFHSRIRWMYFSLFFFFLCHLRRVPFDA